MSARLKPAPRSPVDDWEEFRPAEISRGRSSRSTGSKLLVSVLLFAVLLLVWVLLKPPITGTVAQIRKAISGLGQSPAASRKPRVAAGRTRREWQSARPQRAQELRDPGSAALRPFEVYLLDGDRYIRVDASSRSVLLNTQTGETTWIDSDRVAQNRK